MRVPKEEDVFNSRMNKWVDKDRQAVGRMARDRQILQAERNFELIPVLKRPVLQRPICDYKI
jgi:hypothetical protein